MKVLSIKANGTTVDVQAVAGGFTPVRMLEKVSQLEFYEGTELQLRLLSLPAESSVDVRSNSVVVELGLRCLLLNGKGLRPGASLRLSFVAMRDANGWTLGTIELDGVTSAEPGWRSLGDLASQRRPVAPLLDGRLHQVSGDWRSVARYFSPKPAEPDPVDVYATDSQDRILAAEDCLPLHLLGSPLKWRESGSEHQCVAWFEAAPVPQSHARYRFVIGRVLDSRRWDIDQPGNGHWDKSRPWPDNTDFQRSRMQSRLRGVLGSNAHWTGVELKPHPDEKPPVVSQCLPWNDTEVGDDNVEWLIRIHGLPAQSTLEAWNHWLVGAHAAMLRASAGYAGLSLAPKLENAAEWSMTASVRLRDPAAFTGASLWLVEDFSARTLPSLSTDLVISIEPVGDPSVSLPQLRTHTGKALQLSVRAAPPHAAVDDAGTTSADFTPDWTRVPKSAAYRGVMSCQIIGAISARDATLAIGSLDLTVASAQSSNPIQLMPTLHCFGVDHAIEPELGHPKLAWLNSLGELPLAAIQPAAVDPLPEEGAANTHQMLENSGSALVYMPEPLNKAAYRLSFKEEMKPRGSRGMQLKLMQTQAASDARRFVYVLDSAPFFVGAFELSNALRSENPAESTEVGILDLGGSGSGTWRLRTRADRSEILLPPQAIGEEVERRMADGLSPAQPMQQRLGPLLRMDVSLRGKDQEFAPAPWNWRHRFGHPSLPEQAASVSSAELELLYGLLHRIQAPHLRLQESHAWRGRLPAALDNRHAQAAAWNTLLGSYKYRVAMLQASQGDQPLLLRESDGLSAELRRNADVKAPVPLPSGSNLPHSDHGILGGALVGVEMFPVYEAIWRKSLGNAKADTAELADWKVTALGGFGSTKGSFDNRRSSIQARVSMGRVTHYAVERIGRIGAFWNRAKHVVVYERTVGRAARYSLENDYEEQHPRRQQPVVRKIDEYIEVLEPLRRYPENADGNPTATGPIRAIRFHDRIIRVKREWTEQISDNEIRVPLWRLGIPDELKLLFPKPQIALQLEVAVQAQDAMAECAIDDPQNLYFYTTTDPLLDDRTDLWPAALGVDYAAVPDPRPPAKAYSDANLDDQVPDPSPVAPGFESFTWTLARGDASAQVNLVAQRQDRAITAAIERVSLQRGSGQGADVGLARIAEASTRLGDLRARVERLLVDPGAAVDLKSAVGDLTRLLQSVAADGTLGQFDPCQLICLTIETELNRIRTAWIDELKQWSARLVGNIRSLAPINDDAKRAIYEQISLGAAQLSGGLAQLEAPLERAGADLIQLQTELPKLKEEAKARVAAISDWIAEVSARGIKDLAARETALKNQWQRLDAQLAALGDRLAQHPLLNRFSNTVLTLPDGSTLKPVPKLRDAYRKAHMAVRTAAANLLTEINKGGQQLQARLLDLDQAARNLLAELDMALAQLKSVAEQKLLELGNAVNAARSELSQLQPAIGVLASQLRQIVANHNAVETMVEAVSEFIDAKRADLDADMRAVIGRCGQKPQPLNTLLGLVHHKVCPLLGQIASDLASQVADLLRSIQLPTLDLPALSKTLDDLLPNLDGQLRHWLDGLRGHKRGDLQFSLKRMFGELPKLPGLDFSADRIAYFFADLAPSIDLTPVTAWLDRIGAHLKAMGLRLPTLSLGDGLESGGQLANLSLGKLFPDFAGLKLDGLFKGIKFPKIDERRVRVRYGIDRDRRLAWVEADINVDLDSATLFSVAGVELHILSPKLIASSRLEVDEDGGSKLRSEGKIQGDWQIRLAGQALVTLVDTTVLIDQQGRFSVDIKPDRIQFNGALKPIKDLLARVSDPDNGFTLALLEKDGRPFGVESKLDLQLPPLSFGAFGVTGMSLGARMALLADPRFLIQTNLNLGRADSPFTVTVFVLGGAGYIEFDCSYEPSGGALETRLALSVGASAMVGFNFGPIRGHLQIFFGISARFMSSASQRSFAVAVVASINGAVVVWGFVRIGLHVHLEIEYRDDGGMTGRGHVSIEVRISRFFKKSFRSRLSYEFKKGTRSGQNVSTYRQSRV